MKKRTGFTLVELLVVIAIIGILAGMLFPAIAGAMANSKATKVGNDGKQIWLMLFSENTDRVAINETEVWPYKTGAPYVNANEYFEYGGNSTNDWFSGLPVSMLSAPGLSPGNDWTNILAANMAWCLVRDLSSGSSADMPFMFTKNMSSGQSYPTTGAIVNTINVFFKTGKPFGDAMGVVITWGGSVKILKKKRVKSTILFQRYFNPTGEDTLDILAPA